MGKPAAFFSSLILILGILGTGAPASASLIIINPDTGLQSLFILFENLSGIRTQDDFQPTSSFGYPTPADLNHTLTLPTSETVPGFIAGDGLSTTVLDSTGNASNASLGFIFDIERSARFGAYMKTRGDLFFQVTEEATYDLTGYLNLMGGDRVFYFTFLRDESTGLDLFSNVQESRLIPITDGETFTLGGLAGSYGNSLTGNLMGTLTPGRTYLLSYEYIIQALNTQVAGAEAIGDLRFDVSVAAVPEPATLAIICFGLACLGLAVRQKADRRDSPAKIIVGLMIGFPLACPIPFFPIDARAETLVSLRSDFIEADVRPDNGSWTSECSDYTNPGTCTALAYRAVYRMPTTTMMDISFELWVAMQEGAEPEFEVTLQSGFLAEDLQERRLSQEGRTPGKHISGKGSLLPDKWVLLQRPSECALMGSSDKLPGGGIYCDLRRPLVSVAEGLVRSLQDRDIWAAFDLRQQFRVDLIDTNDK